MITYYVGICHCLLAIIIASFIPFVECWLPVPTNHQIDFLGTSGSSSRRRRGRRRTQNKQVANQKVVANRIVLPVCWSSVQGQQQQQQQDDKENSNGDGGDDNGDTSYRRALKMAEDEAFQKFIQNEAPPWLQEQKSMPFACTECGKCCKTQGSVYLSPKEIENAATLLGMESSESFIRKYASHTISDNNRGQVWIRLRETIISPDDTTPSCIFLDPDTNYCRIYEARPVQCKTYPFWPSILKSRETWNNECRRRDDYDEEEGGEDDGTAISPPAWSPEIGGCEGMTPIDATCDDKDNDDDNSLQVPVDEAYKELYNYIVDDRRLPTGDEMPVE